jgi:hypothetical protein
VGNDLPNSKRQDWIIRKKTDEIVAILIALGTARLPNQNTGWLEDCVCDELKRRYPYSDLVVKLPPRGLGGECIFRSVNYLGTQSNGRTP